MWRGRGALCSEAETDKLRPDSSGRRGEPGVGVLKQVYRRGELTLTRDTGIRTETRSLGPSLSEAELKHGRMKKEKVKSLSWCGRTRYRVTPPRLLMHGARTDLRVLMRVLARAVLTMVSTSGTCLCGASCCTLTFSNVCGSVGAVSVDVFRLFGDFR